MVTVPYEPTILERYVKQQTNNTIQLVLIIQLSYFFYFIWQKDMNVALSEQRCHPLLLKEEALKLNGLSNLYFPTNVVILFCSFKEFQYAFKPPAV